MSGNNSFASLSPTLLARKGGAKPAMRPQLQPLHEFHEATARDMGDDLGWNDMGFEPAFGSLLPEGGAEVVSIAGDSTSGHESGEVPRVVHQQADLSRKLARGSTKAGKRVAFTLRLDAERHLKLRVACAVLGRSAQDIVTEALDSQLAAIADIDSLTDEIRKRR